MSRSTSRRPRLATALATAALTVSAGVLALTVPGVAGALPGVARDVNPPQNPTSVAQVPNIDRVRTAIKQYYGDTTTTTKDPVNGTTDLHTFDPDGAYAKETEGRVDSVDSYLTSRLPSPGTGGKQKVLLLDIDDTSLNTYNYEIYSNFAYTPASNAAFVNSAAFPAVPGMVALANKAVDEGYTLFFLTGRPEAQRSGTVTNLADAGFPEVPSDHLVLKDLTKPIYSSCAPSCTTIQYKSLTRKNIQEGLGFRIVANVGDQQSDLAGGYADKTFKLPNPMYYLP